MAGKVVTPDVPRVVESSALPSGRRAADWDVREAPKNYGLLVAAQAASAALSFAAVWLATRYLGPAGYGGVVAIIAAAQFISQLTVNWSAVALARYGVEEFVATGRIVETFWARTLVFLPNVLLVVAAFPLWLPTLSNWLRIPPRAFPLVLALLLTSTLSIHVQQGLLGAKLPRMQGGLLTIERALILIIILTLSLTGKASLFAITLAYVLAPLGAAVVGLWRLRDLIYPPVMPGRSPLKRLLIFSFPLLPFSFIGYLSTNYADAIFISHFLSAADLGIYAVVYQLSGMMMQLPLLVGSLMMPLFVTLQSTGRDTSVVRFMREVLPSASLLWSVACVFAAAVGGYLVPLVFGNHFKQAATLLWPLMAAAAMAGPILMGYAAFSNAKSTTYIAMVGAAASAVINVVLNLLLIPRFGLVGCAWATTAAYAINTLVVIGLVHSRLNLPWSWILQALLAAILAAAYASWRGGNLGALFVGLAVTALVAFLHRKVIISGLQALNYRRVHGINGPLAEP